MALKFISFFFLLTFFFIQINARDFFSKVSPTTTTTVNPTTTTTKEDENLNKQEQEPNFMQETKNPYGLYVQENINTEFPTTTKLGNAQYTTTTYTPYNAQTQYRNQEAFNPNPDYNNDDNNNYYNNNNNDQFYNNNNNNDQFYNNNNNGYDQQQNFGETSLKENSYNTDANPIYDNNKNTKYYNGGNGYTNNERQGMSDTRFLENGKYYHDVQAENNNYKYNPNQYQSSRPNNYGTSAYYNTNSNAKNNNNNNNNYNNSNDNENYEFDKTMENFENEFQEDEQNNNLP